MRKRNRMGFTLPELLVVLLLTGTVLGLGGQCLRQTLEWQTMRISRMELEANLQNGMEWIINDIQNSSFVTSCSVDSVNLIGESVVQYTLGADPQATEHLLPLHGNVLYRKTSGTFTRQPMANFITEMTFYYYDFDGNPTTNSEQVQAVEVELKGIFDEKEIVVKECAQLSSGLYL